MGEVEGMTHNPTGAHGEVTGSLQPGNRDNDNMQ